MWGAHKQWRHACTDRIWTQYDSFSEDSAEEISKGLADSNFGGEMCMAEFNGTTTIPHTEYICDAEGYCYKKDHTHEDGAILYVALFFTYFLILGIVLTWPISYSTYDTLEKVNN